MFFEVIRNRLLAGAYPGHLEESEHQSIVKAIINHYVTTFVCLQTTGELQRFKPYKETALTLSKYPSQLQFIHFPIPGNKLKL